MKLSEYFEQTKGLGVLATADAEGKVNVAIYARPHFLRQGDDSSCALIMSDRASHDNVQANPHAAYLFVEEGEDHAGKRLTLTLVGEETDIEKIQSIRRRSAPPVSEEGPKYLVHFRIDAVRPLLGAE
ncbi:MAG: pyridoxamine 5'-phosphate oxidase family protein [Pirellulales bacterium]|nr:pyridoxamine 5'-phosphate oxidase family protein [Thermoguttaceae bacterium]MDD4786190.1 pyridoxamine 5'-phosphate oxidase family protein [Pirellulales bacterium]MDI9444742.1 pyridoxamine 5'-phosphate oxidase family protein [Planctomycetota bacterium]NLZ02279.1 pyridoxamine 5'-phosphate oxidase family protein [Pirellulaceae bacterium]